MVTTNIAKPNKPHVAPLEGQSFYKQTNLSNIDLIDIHLEMKNITNMTYHNNTLC